MPVDRFSFLQAVQDAAGFSDEELAAIAGIGRSTVQAYRSGRLPEYLDGRQREALKRAARLLRDRLALAVDELELL